MLEDFFALMSLISITVSCDTVDIFLGYLYRCKRRVTEGRLDQPVTAFQLQKGFYVLV